MNGMPLLSQVSVQDQDPKILVDSLSAPSEPRRTGIWARLRPETFEKAVLVSDFFILVCLCLLSDIAYQVAGAGTPATRTASIGFGFIFAVNFITFMSIRKNYSLKRLLRFSRQAREFTAVWLMIFGMLTFVAFTMKIGTEFSRGSAFTFFLAGFAVFMVWRMAVTSMARAAVANGAFAKKRIIVVAEQGQIAVSRPLVEIVRHGCLPVRTFEISHSEMTSPGITTSLGAKLAQLILDARSERVEDVYLLVGWHHRRKIEAIMDVLAVLPVSVHLVPDDNAARFLNSTIIDMGATWAAELRRAPLTKTEMAAKRLFDLSLSVVAITLLSPVLLAIGLLVKMDSPGPALFFQKRNGFNGHAFEICKFRTMTVMEEGENVRQADRDDPRVTRIGRWLRRLSIDELPQLINVIAGDMSLVGPRPHATCHDSEYEKLIAKYAFRHHVKPGITGWAQVNGFRGGTPRLEMMEQRIEHDIWYINNWTPWLDVKIILQTVLVSLRHPSAY